VTELQYKRPNEFDRATTEYLGKFPLKVRVTLGQSYTPYFQEFHEWCSDNLGDKYKDWFLVNVSKSDYNLYIANPKWLSILALRFPDRVDIVSF
jgi:hypothetical protein